MLGFQLQGEAGVEIWRSHLFAQKSLSVISHEGSRFCSFKGWKCWKSPTSNLNLLWMIRSPFLNFIFFLDPLNLCKIHCFLKSNNIRKKELQGCFCHTVTEKNCFCKYFYNLGEGKKSLVTVMASYFGKCSNALLCKAENVKKSNILITGPLANTDVCRWATIRFAYYCWGARVAAGVISRQRLQLDGFLGAFAS